MTAHGDDAAIRATLEALVVETVARADWQDVLRRAADATPERTVASLQWRPGARRARAQGWGTRPRCQPQGALEEAFGWGTRGL